MKLRTKVMIAFLIMTVMPILLFWLVFQITTKHQMKIIRDTYGLPEDYQLRYLDIYSPVTILGQVSEQSYMEISRVAEETPEKFLDVSYLDDLNIELSKKASSIVVTYNGDMTYNSSGYELDEIREIIPQNTVVEGLGNAGIYRAQKYQCLTRAVEYHTDEGVGTIYIITSMNEVIPELKNFIIELIIIIIEILIFTAVILYFWINISFVKPVSKLKLATKNIKEGNLDFKIDTAAKDEMGDLSRGFEAMRVQLKESKEERERYDKEEKELIRNISHDLKTPLTSIKGYVEGLIDGIATTDEKRMKYYHTIKNKAEDMDRLIEQLTLFSRLDNNKIPYEFRKINVLQYFNDCISEIKMDLEAQGITLKYKTNCTEDMEVMADPIQLKRVINNLVSNSVKYKSNERPCVIRIYVFDEGDYLHVEESDNGKGIAEKDLSRIFDRFYRTDESRTSPQSGSGIGLAIVKKIIEDHNGRIWVESIENQGTTFHINLLRYKEGEQLSLPDNQRKSKRKK